MISYAIFLNKKNLSNQFHRFMKKNITLLSSYLIRFVFIMNTFVIIQFNCGKLLIDFTL